MKRRGAITPADAMLAYCVSQVPPEARARYSAFLLKRFRNPATHADRARRLAHAIQLRDQAVRGDLSALEGLSRGTIMALLHGWDITRKGRYGKTPPFPKLPPPLPL